MAAENLKELFVEEIKDIYDAEKQLTKALPKMAKAANDAEIETIVEVADDLTSQARHSLLLQGSPPSG